jgi:hypothetical protein
MRYLIVLLHVAAVTPAVAQNNGLPSQQRSAVLIELIAERGKDCGLLRPWQAAALRTQSRDLIARFDEATRSNIAKEIEAGRAAMTCDDAMLTSWINAAGPNFEREYLPELLTGYRAFAVQSPPPRPFTDIAGRKDYTEALARISAKLSQLEAEGIVPPGGRSWQALAERQSSMAAQITAAIAGTGEPGRFTAEQAVQLAEDVATIVELWLADAPERSG